MVRNVALACCLAAGVVLALATPASSQIVQYRFTGTRTGGSEEFGNGVSGLVTLDLNAAAYIVHDYTSIDGCGEYRVWKDGNFAVDAVSSTGRAAGTSFGGTTYFEMMDRPCRNPALRYANLHHHFREGDIEIGMYFITQNEGEPDDGVATPADWNPLDDSETFIRIYRHDYATETSEFGDYTLVTFTPVRSTIVVNGCDTGVEDFEYEGRLVSEIIADLAADARKQKQFENAVAKLVRELRRARLLTPAEADAILHCAEGSGGSPGRGNR